MSNRIDEMIEAALRDQDEAAWEELREKGYFQNAIGLFRGPQGWVVWVVMIAQAVLFLAGVWCGVHFLGASEVLPAVKWGIASATLILMATNLKMSLAPQMQAERVLLAVRRLELLLVERRD